MRIDSGAISWDVWKNALLTNQVKMILAVLQHCLNMDSGGSKRAMKLSKETFLESFHKATSCDLTNPELRIRRGGGLGRGMWPAKMAPTQHLSPCLTLLSLLGES